MDNKLIDYEVLWKELKEKNLAVVDYYDDTDVPLTDIMKTYEKRHIEKNYKRAINER
jgi:hypothetical protein